MTDTNSNSSTPTTNSDTPTDQQSQSAPAEQDAGQAAQRVLALLEQAATGGVGDDATPGSGLGATTMEKGEGDWWYDLNGLRVTTNPDHQLVGAPTDNVYKGLPMLSDAPPKPVPSTVVSYVPVELPGAVSPLAEAAAKLTDGIPIAYEGEAGTGKNTLFDTIHSNTNRPLYRSNLGTDTSIFDLINEKDAVTGTTVNILGDLSKAAIFGGTWLGDEVNMVDGDVTSHIHAVAERPGKRRLELHGTGRMLTDLPEDVEWDPDKHLGRYLHPEFKVAATMNPIEYGATKEMNNAFRGRFAVKELDYLGADKEAGLIAADVGVDKPMAKQLVQLANELREMYRNNKLRCPISYRQLYHTLHYYKTHRGAGLDDAANAELVGYAQLQVDREAIKDAIDDEL